MTTRIKNYYSRKGGTTGRGGKKSKKYHGKQFETLDGLDYPGEDLVAQRKLYTKYIDGEPFSVGSVSREAAISDLPYTTRGN